MKKFVSVLVVLILLVAAPVWAQRTTPAKTQPATTPAMVTPLAPVLTPAPVPTPETTQPNLSMSSTELKATPEMWFYEQYMREYKNPKNAVRANAEFAAQQRANRLAAMRWFGFSNSRPRVGADPVNNYPPAWSSNTPMQPNRWQGTGGQPYYVARPEVSVFRSY